MIIDWSIRRQRENNDWKITEETTMVDKTKHFGLNVTTYTIIGNFVHKRFVYICLHEDTRRERLHKKIVSAFE